jgi:hypothetical protein
MKYTTKRSIWAFCVVGLILFGACGKKTKQEDPAKAAGNAAAPKIAAVDESFDFGKIKQGTDVEHVFKIKNNGNADLLIEKARGS